MTEEVLKLPKLLRETREFETRLKPDDVKSYVDKRSHGHGLVHPLPVGSAVHAVSALAVPLSKIAPCS